jgi:hypothetical protein
MRSCLGPKVPFTWTPRSSVRSSRRVFIQSHAFGTLAWKAICPWQESSLRSSVIACLCHQPLLAGQRQSRERVISPWLELQCRRRQQLCTTLNATGHKGISRVMHIFRYMVLFRTSTIPALVIDPAQVSIRAIPHDHNYPSRAKTMQCARNKMQPDTPPGIP